MIDEAGSVGGSACPKSSCLKTTRVRARVESERWPNANVVFLQAVYLHDDWKSW